MYFVVFAHVSYKNYSTCQTLQNIELQLELKKMHAFSVTDLTPQLRIIKVTSVENLT